MNRSQTAAIVIGSAALGALSTLVLQAANAKRKEDLDPETDYSRAHALVWNSIGGAMGASQMYLGDKLELYSALRSMCAEDGTSVTAPELAQRTGLNVRWLREWLAQQAAMGVLLLLPGTRDDDEGLKYRLPKAMGEVLADECSPEYDVAMVQLVPALVNRAKTSLPDAFRTGRGVPYNEPDVANAIDRFHRRYIRDCFIPQVVPKACGGSVHAELEEGCLVADLGCGGGNLLVAMAKRYPNSTFHGYEVSDEALACALFNVGAAGLKNVKVHDARKEPLHRLGSGRSDADADNLTFDVVLTLDVLHDAPFPRDLIAQVRGGLRRPSEGGETRGRRQQRAGVWLLADIACQESVRENLRANPAAATMWAFSTCLCMACALSEPNGEGLGTLGFTVPVARKLLGEAGFTDVTVLHEADNTRWFQVMAPN